MALKCFERTRLHAGASDAVWREIPVPENVETYTKENSGALVLFDGALYQQGEMTDSGRGAKELYCVLSAQSAQRPEPKYEQPLKSHLVALRHKLSLSQDEAASTVGVSRITWNAFENGKISCKDVEQNMVKLFGLTDQSDLWRLRFAAAYHAQHHALPHGVLTHDEHQAVNNTIAQASMIPFVKAELPDTVKPILFVSAFYDFYGERA